MNVKFLLFVIIVFLIYFSVNAYIFARGWQALPSGTIVRPIYSIVFLFCCLSFFVVMMGEGRLPNWVIATLYPVSSVWLAAMLYFLLCVILVDLSRVANYFFHFFPDVATAGYAKFKLGAMCTVITIVAITLSVGYYRFTHPSVTQLELTVPKKAGETKQLRIVMASDVHLGHSIKNNRLKDYINKINALNADIVLFVGDVIDRDLNYVINKGMGAEFKQLKASLGVFGVLGNHEYISQHVENAYNYLDNSGITMLRDSAIEINSSFYIIGRDDFSNAHRKTVNELIDTLDKSLPLILLDHQPMRLQEAEKAGIDLQLSGHTHDGQLFPLNLITRNVYILSYGYKLLGNTHIYVSSGLGLWGPPFRVGTKSELVVITLHFN